MPPDLLFCACLRSLRVPLVHSPSAAFVLSAQLFRVTLYTFTAVWIHQRYRAGWCDCRWPVWLDRYLFVPAGRGRGFC